MRGLIVAAAVAAALVTGGAAAHAQEAVVGITNSEHLFTDKDPVKNRNKQAAYHIMKDLLEAGHWNEADKWLTKAYHQHNPQAASGLDGVVYFFTQVMKVQPKPVPEKLGTPIVAVLAEGDLVTVVTPRTLKDPKDASKTYTTTWFDMWRFKDGKADEHWDPAEKR
jgi:predicted SnoaL-like aldol condensation-catalyzing enzyme